MSGYGLSGDLSGIAVGEDGSFSEAWCPALRRTPASGEVSHKISAGFFYTSVEFSNKNDNIMLFFNNNIKNLYKNSLAPQRM